MDKSNERCKKTILDEQIAISAVNQNFIGPRGVLEGYNPKGYGSTEVNRGIVQ
jgi:hypothetical protein